jgi:hypothetical protein
MLTHPFPLATPLVLVRNSVGLLDHVSAVIAKSADVAMPNTLKEHRTTKAIKQALLLLLFKFTRYHARC